MQATATPKTTVEVKPGRVPRASACRAHVLGHDLDAAPDGVGFCRHCEAAFAVEVPPGVWYVGITIAGAMDWRAVVVEDGQAHDLDPRYDLANHSPDGFSWGYSGSGPAQLALAIVSDFVARVFEVSQATAGAVALRWYKHFKATTLAPLDGDACFVLGASTGGTEATRGTSLGVGR